VRRQRPHVRERLSLALEREVPIRAFAAIEPRVEKLVRLARHERRPKMGDDNTGAKRWLETNITAVAVATSKRAVFHRNLFEIGLYSRANSRPSMYPLDPCGSRRKKTVPSRVTLRTKTSWPDATLTKDS
jgi:hypothetical protein